MGLRINIGFSVTGVVWITAVHPHEQERLDLVLSDFESLHGIHGIPNSTIPVTSAQELHEALEAVAGLAIAGLKPIVNFVIHGNKTEGMYLPGENVFVPWSWVLERLQAINVPMRNTLCVLSLCCFSLNVITELSVTRPAPFNILIAPEETVTFADIYQHVFQFYEDLWTSGDISKAFDQNLQRITRVVYSEKVLAVSLGRYLLKACRGKPVAARRERLITEVVLGGMKPTKENLRFARAQLKAHLKPSQALVDRYAGRFLIGNPANFTIDDLLAMIDGRETPARPEELGT